MKNEQNQAMSYFISRITFREVMISIKYLLSLLVITLLNVAIASQKVEESSSQSANNGSIITFHIEHALDPLREHFTPRTRIQLMVKSDGRQGLKYLDRNTIVGNDLESFKHLLQSNSLYTIRIRSEKPEWQGHFVVSSIPACELQKTGFKEDIGVYLSDSGNIVGVDYHVPKMTIAMDCDASKIKDLVTLQTRISISEEQQTQPLPLQLQSGRPHFLQNVKLTEGTEEAGQPEQKQHQSFLSRYWYIVVGLVLYLFVGGAEPPKDPKQQGAEQGGANQTKTPKSSSTSSSAAPSSSSARSKKE